MRATIGRYQILETLGQGSMGVVYKAFDPTLNRVLALKTMAASFEADKELKTRFYREAQAAATLQHPNIVTVYELGEEGDQMFIAMEFVQGKSLRELIAADANLERKLDVMIQICQALSHAHHHGIVHRDIKPSNIHVTDAGIVKILDFGIAHLTSSDLTQTGMAIGTPEYMSPELIRGEKADNRSDIFSCGIVFYEFLTRIKPFYDPSIPALFYNILQKNPTPLHELNEGYPPALSAAIAKALEKNREKRFSRLEELIEILQEVQSHLFWMKTERIQELRKIQQEIDQQIESTTLDDQGRELVARMFGPELDRFRAGVRKTSNPSDSSVNLLLLEEELKSARDLNQRLQDFIDRGLEEWLHRERKCLEQLLKSFNEDRFAEAEGLILQLQELHSDPSLIDQWKQRISERELERERAERQGKVEKHLASTERLFMEGDLDSSKELLQMILKMDPDCERAREMLATVLTELERREKERKRRQTIESLSAEAQTEFERKNFSNVTGLCREILKLDAAHSFAQELVQHSEDALREIQLEAEKKQRKADLLARARRELEAKKFKDCFSTLEEILSFEPASEAAASLKQKAQREFAPFQEEQRIQETVGQLWRKAEKLYRDGNLEETLQICAEIQEILPNHSDSAALEKEARTQLQQVRQEKDRRQRTSELYADAQQLYHQEHFDACLVKLNLILKLDPNHPQSIRLRNLCQTALERLRDYEQIRSKLDELLSKAEKALVKGNTEKALALCDQALALDFESSKAQALRKRVEEIVKAKDAAAKQRREILKLEETAEVAFLQGDWQSCQESSERLLEFNPGNEKAFRLLEKLAKLQEAPDATSGWNRVQIPSAKSFYQKRAYQVSGVIVLVLMLVLALNIPSKPDRPIEPPPPKVEVKSTTPPKPIDNTTSERLSKLELAIESKAYADPLQLPSVLANMQVIARMDPGNKIVTQAEEQIESYYQHEANKATRAERWKEADQHYQTLMEIFPHDGKFKEKRDELKGLESEAERRDQRQKEAANKQAEVDQLKSKLNDAMDQGRLLDACELLVELRKLASFDRAVREASNRLRTTLEKIAGENYSTGDFGRAIGNYERLKRYFPESAEIYDRNINRIRESMQRPKP